MENEKNELFEVIFDKFELEFLLLFEHFIHHVIFSFLASNAGLYNLLIQNELNFELYLEKRLNLMKNLAEKTEKFLETGLDKEKKKIKRRIMRDFTHFVEVIHQATSADINHTNLRPK